MDRAELWGRARWEGQGASGAALSRRVDPVERGTLAVEPGCDLDGVDFLPPVLAPLLPDLGPGRGDQVTLPGSTIVGTWEGYSAGPAFYSLSFLRSSLVSSTWTPIMSGTGPSAWQIGSYSQRVFSGSAEITPMAPVWTWVATP